MIFGYAPVNENIDIHLCKKNYENPYDFEVATKYIKTF